MVIENLILYFTTIKSTCTFSGNLPVWRGYYRALIETCIFWEWDHNRTEYPKPVPANLRRLVSDTEDKIYICVKRFSFERDHNISMLGWVGLGYQQ